MSAEAGSGAPARRDVELVKPADVQEVADVLRAAAAAGRRVRPTGGDAADRDAELAGADVVLSTEALQGIEVYEPADLTLTASAGTRLSALNAAVAEHDQFLPFDPPHVSQRTLGELVATGFGGPLSSSYGTLRDHVLGVTLVTGTGAVLKLGGRVMKNVAGFDLVRLVVGSRGSLGVVVSACIRVFPRPAADRVLALEGGLSEIVTAARSVATAPVVPASAVVYAPDDGSALSLLVRLHGSPAVVDADEAVLEDRVGRRFRTVDGEAAAELVAAVRDACSEDPVLLRLTALPASLPALVAQGSDGPFLADVMTGEVRLAPRDVSEGALRALAGRARELGGSASFLAAPQELAGLLREPGPADALVAKLRATFDPQGVLRPGAPA